MNAPWIDLALKYVVAPAVPAVLAALLARVFDERSHRKIDKKLNILLNGKALREMQERGEA